MRLGLDFFTRDVLDVAPDLVGVQLVRAFPNGHIERFTVTEVEAYRGEDDLACHACKGKTQRTSVMYMQGGVTYVYLIYGMHWMLNVVTGPKDFPQAVLIRGVLGCEGPGRVGRLLEIDKSFNGVDITGSNQIWFESGESVPNIKTGPRIGVNYAGLYWANMPWRFWIAKVDNVLK